MIDPQWLAPKNDSSQAKTLLLRSQINIILLLSTILEPSLGKRPLSGLMTCGRMVISASGLRAQAESFILSHFLSREA